MGGSTKVEAPPPRDYAGEMRDTLKAQIEMAPELYASQAAWAPKYQALELDMFRKAAPEMLDIYGQMQPRLSEIENQARTAGRAADISDIETLGPKAREAIRKASPEQASIVDTLLGQAKSQVAAGNALTPQQQRQVQQSIRASMSSRGMAEQGSGVMAEAVAEQMQGMGLQQQRAQFAQGAMANSQALYGDVFQQVLGRPSGTFQALQGYGGQAQGFNPGQIFNPESQYAADLYNQGYQADMSARIATADAANKRSGAIIGAIGTVAGGLLGGPFGAALGGSLFGAKGVSGMAAAGRR